MTNKEFEEVTQIVDKLKCEDKDELLFLMIGKDGKCTATIQGQTGVIARVLTSFVEKDPDLRNLMLASTIQYLLNNQVALNAFLNTLHMKMLGKMLDEVIQEDTGD